MEDGIDGVLAGLRSRRSRYCKRVWAAAPSDVLSILLLLLGTGILEPMPGTWTTSSLAPNPEFEEPQGQHTNFIGHAMLYYKNDSGKL